MDEIAIEIGKMMKKRTIERSMFYNASPEIFLKAERLRKNMTEAEKVLWIQLRKDQLGVRFKAQHPIERFIVDSCLPAGRFTVIRQSL